MKKYFFSVPDQDFSKWFEDPETAIREEKQYTTEPKARLIAGKMKIAETINQKYGACLYDPFHQFFSFCKKGDVVFAEVHLKYLALTIDIRIIGHVNLDELFNDLCKFYE